MASANGRRTVELQTFAGEDHPAVVLPGDCTCEQALSLIAKRLELKTESMQVFGLFVGRLGAPVKVLQPSSKVSMDTQLSLQRWYMPADEAKLVKHDDKAIHLLYHEAKHKLDCGDLHPTEDQMQELESFSDPFFPTERQFVEVARKVRGYSTVVAKRCTVVDEIDDNSAKIASGTRVNVTMDLDGLAITSEDGSQHLQWPWTVVRRWKRMVSAQSTVIKFEVCLQKLNAGVLCWISLDSPQAQFLFQASGTICAEVKRQQELKKGFDDPSPRLAGKFYDPLKEWMDNVLFVQSKFSNLKL